MCDGWIFKPRRSRNGNRWTTWHNVRWTVKFVLYGTTYHANTKSRCTALESCKSIGSYIFFGKISKLFGAFEELWVRFSDFGVRIVLCLIFHKPVVICHYILRKFLLVFFIMVKSYRYNEAPPPRTDVLGKILRPWRRSFGGLLKFSHMGNFSHISALVCVILLTGQTFWSKFLMIRSISRIHALFFSEAGVPRCGFSAFLHIVHRVCL